MKNEFRKELKYEINENDFNVLNYNLKRILQKDKFCKKEFYTVTSIYFDNYQKTSYVQVKNGISERWKYRIRFYDYNAENIYLEKKYKINGLTNKKKVKISRQLLNQLLKDKAKIQKTNNALVNELITKMKVELLRPIICIEYDRIPYTYKTGNVRITLDFNIRYTKNFANLFDNSKKMLHLQNKILEVKYNYLIPDFILYSLASNNLINTSFSKFLNCLDDSMNRRCY